MDTGRVVTNTHPFKSFMLDGGGNTVSRMGDALDVRETIVGFLGKAGWELPFGLGFCVKPYDVGGRRKDPGGTVPEAHCWGAAS